MSKPMDGWMARLAECARIALTIALLWAAGPAKATPEYLLPTLFDVTGVAADDVLNIRARPSADAEIIGSLRPDARGVEVVAHDGSGRWAQVNTDGRHGWVALRYLAYRTDVWEFGDLPESLRCFGTEPFWSLTPEDTNVAFSRAGTPDETFTLSSVLDSGGFRSPRRAFLADNASQRLTAVIVPATCSDGMSDRVFGLDVTLVLEDEEGTRMLTGCCSISPGRESSR